ncbi:putative transcriptional regulator [Salinisphaera sp. T5B8]|uniref:helix-turn-helix domain-containing protein n=1 Tax=Salinisphaera sp. T5B8 TaxID=1304154 RepID=UPI00334167EB
MQLPLAMQVTTLKQLGAFIRDQRRQRNWTQMQLAQASGTLQSWLSGVEKGKGNPEFGKIMAVLRALDVTLDLQRPRPAPAHAPPAKTGTTQPARPRTQRRMSSGELATPQGDRAVGTSRTSARAPAIAPTVQSLRNRFRKKDET